MVVGIRQTSSAISAVMENADAGVDAEGLEGDDDQQEDEGERREQNRERDLVGRLLAFRALDEADHVIEKALAGIGRDADQQFGRRARACRR